MQGLMLKLLNVDAAGERALRVVAYFDELLAHRPDLESVVRATAILADCPAGLRLPGEAQVLHFTADGDAVAQDRAPAVSSSIEIEADDLGDRRGHAWLEREGARGDLDEFILERVALVVTSVLDRRGNARFTDSATGFADPALAALLVNERASEADRVRAARLMGINLPGKVQAIAIATNEAGSSDIEQARLALTQVAGHPPYLAQMTNDLILGLVTVDQKVPWTELPLENRTAVGPLAEVVNAPKSWCGARETLRFAGLGPSWPRHLCQDQVGGLTLLLGLDPVAVLADDDVRAIQRLSETTSGGDAILVLDYVLHADSVRSAARDANFHHSSLQSRLHRIEAVLGVDLKDGADRQRATQALLLWQLFTR